MASPGGSLAMGDADSGTRVSLLGRLRGEPTDQHAWGEFVERYGPRIFAWCRRWNAQDSDAEDITQAVLFRLTEKMRDFAYDPSRSFRSWLKTLTHHAWYDFIQVQRRPGRGSGDSGVVDLLDSVEARDDLARQLGLEYESRLFEEVRLRVQLRVAPPTWESFRLTAIEGLVGAEAARRLGISASQVYVHKFRVQKLLQEEVLRLDAAGGT